MSDIVPDDPVLPPRLASLGLRTPVTIGQSGAKVWRIASAGETLFLKAEPIHPLSEIPSEAQRLRWLATTPIPAPLLRDSFDENGWHWLLLSSLPGADLTHLVDRPADLRHALATGLRAMHGLDVTGCPFDSQLDAKLAAGLANAAAGRVDEADFDDARKGWTAGQVVSWLLDNRPPLEDLVVCHGDASLPNVMADATGFSGFIDVGRLGVADRWQDLAIACRSLIYNCGPDHVAPFLAQYGVAWDEARYRYYCTLDELF